MPTTLSSCCLVTPILTATPMPCMISALSGPTCGQAGRKQGKQGGQQSSSVSNVG
jgi:hypothetical protein